MTGASQTIDDDAGGDFLSFIATRNTALPTGIYSLRLIPRTAQLINADLPDAYDLENLPPDTQQGLKFRFQVVEAPNAKDVGREVYADFLLSGGPLDANRVDRGAKAIASWINAGGINLNGDRRLDRLSLALEKASAGKLLRARLGHWHTRAGAARVYIERVGKLVEAPR